MAGSGRVFELAIGTGRIALPLTAKGHDITGTEAQRVRISSDGMKLVPLPMRYAYPPELDLMARLAGLELENRWGDWQKGAFTKDSTMHVSVYRKPG
jgi:hypothetical protein